MIDAISKIWKFLQGLFKSPPGSNSINFSNQGDVKNNKIKYENTTNNHYYTDTSIVVPIESEEYTSNYEEINSLFEVTVLLSVPFGASFCVLCSFLPFWKFWFIPIILILSFIFFNKIKYRINSAANLLCNHFFKLKAFNFWTIAILNIDLNRKNHLSRAKHFVFLCLVILSIVFNIIISSKLISKDKPKGKPVIEFEHNTLF